jgi:dTDP-4-dehydrorhamnose reductase
MKKILITGSKGQLGKEFHHIMKEYPSFRFTFTDIDELDITETAALKKFFEKNNPDVVINCAAYTAVDLAEQETEKANLINGKAVGNLARVCKESKALLIHISTDYIFDGTLSRPIREDDKPNPVSAYAKSKHLGETEILKNSKSAVIIRTSWLYSTFGKNFVKTIMKHACDKRHLRVVYDQVGCPTYARDLAMAIMQMLPSLEKHKGVEVFHYSNDGVASWYDFATAITEFAGLVCRIDPILTKDYPLPAHRPAYSVLDKEKIKARFGLSISNWRESLLECITELLSTKYKNYPCYPDVTVNLK